eukprot:NODE_10_length_61504_cov_0.956502.p33 type:complete len:207 gc:universal NODE_10_length_61504_cov_0.956502:40323-40943(+)
MRFSLSNVTKNLVARNLPEKSKFIFTGEKGSGKSSILFQYLSKKESSGAKVTLIDAEKLINGHRRYQYTDGKYFLDLDFLKTSFVGIDNVNAFLGYTEYSSIDNKPLHSLDFENIKLLLQSNNFVGAESGTLVVKKLRNCAKNLSVYNNVPKVTVTSLTKPQISELLATTADAKDTNLSRLLLLTGGLPREINRSIPLENLGRSIV